MQMSQPFYPIQQQQYQYPQYPQNMPQPEFSGYVPTEQTDSDDIVLNTVDTYMAANPNGRAAPRDPSEALYIRQLSRNALYSKIAWRFPRLARYVLNANLDMDLKAKGIDHSLRRHLLDPVFVQILMDYLVKHESPEENGATGAYIAKVMNDYIAKNWNQDAAVPDATKKKKDKDDAAAEAPKKNDLSAIKHLQLAVNQLFTPIASRLMMNCGNLTEPEAIAISACIAMDNRDSVREIIKADLPITAKIFDIVVDPSRIIQGALLIEKNEFPKLTPNQQTFIDTLKTWVYEKLNMLPMQQIEQLVMAWYGTDKPETQQYIIQLKSCGTQYSNLLEAAKYIQN